MRRAVVVDDEAPIRMLLTYALEELSLKVCTFENGSTVLAHLDKAPCDVLLLDYQLPGMTGLEIAEAVRCHHPLLPIALITGSAHLVSDETIRAAGITRLFPKPFDLDEVLGWVEGQLGLVTQPGDS